MFTYTDNFLQNNGCFQFQGWVGCSWWVQLAVGRQWPPAVFFIFGINGSSHCLSCEYNVWYDSSLGIVMDGYFSRMPMSSLSVASSQLRCVNIPLMRLFGGCIITLLVNNFPTVQFKFNGYLSRIPQSSSSVASSQSRLRSQRDSRGTQSPDLQVNSVWLIFLFSRFLDALASLAFKLSLSQWVSE